MISAAALVVATVLGLGSMQGLGSAPSAAQQVAASERAWSEAFLRHDLQAISQLLADDFVGIDGRGMVSDKAAELEEAKPPSPGTTAPVLVSEQLSDIRVRIYGDAAVLTAINTARFSSERDSTVRYRRTTVWVRRDNRWQCVSFHGSRILESPVSGGGDR
jgi:ketosteroid isomerase-like protein